VRALVVGGTRFVGRAIVEALLNDGHTVTLAHRGTSGAELFPAAERLLLDRDGDLSALATRWFDVTIDACAYQPEQVTRLAEALGARGGIPVLISTVSVYAPPPAAGITEDAPLLDPADDDPDTAYGRGKVACERAHQDAYGQGLVIRPTYVVGPHDYTWRFPQWVARLSAGGRVLAPGPVDDPTQYIDARDQGEWVARLVREGVTGVFHAAAPPPPFSFAELLEEVAAVVAPRGTQLVWVDADVLQAHGLTDAQFPLWSAAAADRFVLAVDPSAALDAGLVPRPLSATITDTLAWVATQPPRGPALDPATEARVLAAAAGPAG